MTASNIPRPQPIAFGADVRDADGTRLHPGMHVTNGDRTGEIVGWDGGTRIRMILDDGLLITIAASECRANADVELGATTRGWKVETDEARPTALVVPARASMFRPTAQRSVLPAPGRSQSRWVRCCARTLAALEPAEAASVARIELAAPALQRVLTDASLPALLDTAITVPAGGRSATAAAELARLWLEGDDTRSIATTTSTERRRLPKFLPSEGLVAVATPLGRPQRRLTTRLNRTDNRIRTLTAGPHGVTEKDLD